MRKLWFEEVIIKGKDDCSDKELYEMAGYYYPIERTFIDKLLCRQRWEVVMLDDCEMTVDTQEHAEILANQQTIIGMLVNMVKK